MTEIESNKLFEFFLMPLSQKKKMLVVSRLAVSVACYILQMAGNDTGVPQHMCCLQSRSIQLL